MPVEMTACDFYDEGSATYMFFPTGCLAKFAETFHDGFRHKSNVLLVLDRERKVLKVVTRKRFKITYEELKASADAHPTGNAADGAEPVATVNRDIENILATDTDNSDEAM